MNKFACVALVFGTFVLFGCELSRDNIAGQSDVAYEEDSTSATVEDNHGQDPPDVAGAELTTDLVADFEIEETSTAVDLEQKCSAYCGVWDCYRNDGSYLRTAVVEIFERHEMEFTLRYENVTIGGIYFFSCPSVGKVTDGYYTTFELLPDGTIQGTATDMWDSTIQSTYYCVIR
ncbi:MAG TPA: hypothetical protein PLV72_02620 [Candidatus Magasanikbacteria bacterium]|nr:hypothetical protein [Candidatus Magasanikbacteria bacterium]